MRNLIVTALALTHTTLLGLALMSHSPLTYWTMVIAPLSTFVWLVRVNHGARRLTPGELLEAPAPLPPLIIGDVHARPELLQRALEVANGRRIVLLGDLLDGPGGAVGSAECVRVARESGMDVVLGNHELYPVFAKDQHQLATWWGEDPAGGTAERIWKEWVAIRQLLNEDDIEWLRSRPLFIKGPGWIAVHAKLTTTLPPQYVGEDGPTPDQIALVDHTDSSPFWADIYGGEHGVAYYGHTRLTTRKGQVFSDYAVLLDWDAKKGGTGAGCVPGEQPFPLL